MTIKDWKELIVGTLITVTKASLIMLLIPIYKNFAEPNYQMVVETLNKQELARISLASLSLFVISSLLYFWLWMRNRDKLKIKFGIYWDRQKNPRCIKCKEPLGNFEPKIPNNVDNIVKSKSFCYSCKTQNYISENGSAVPYSSIIDKV
jgi:hypothetical protein